LACIVLDTDLLVGLLRGEEKAREFIERLWERGDEPVTTAVNIYELYSGAYRRGPRHVEAVRELERLLPVLQLDAKAARLAAEIGDGLRRRGAQLEIRDLLIAAVAVANSCRVATCNVKHFRRVEALAVERWC